MITLLFLMMGVATLQAQSTFKVDYDGGYLDSDEAHCMVETPDGGYLLSGAIWIDDFSWWDMGLMKIDESGNLEWTKTYGAGSMNIEVGYSVFNTSDNGYMLVGGTDGFSDTGMEDMWVIKLDANGDSLWSKVYGGSEQEYGFSGLQTDGGGYLFLGTTNSYGAGFDDIYLVKTDANGNEQWHKTYGTAALETASQIKPTSDGGYIIAGSTNGYADGYVVKIDSIGDTLWTKVMGGVFNDMFLSVQQTNDGGYILTGHTIPEGAVEYDVWLVKLDANGNEEWSKKIGGEKKDEGYSVVQTIDGGYFITGVSESYHQSNEDSDLYMIKTDANGDTVWTAHYGGIYDDGGYYGLQTVDGGFISSGYYYHSGEELNFYLVKVNGEGTLSIPENNYLNNEDINIYPNPVTSSTTLYFNNPENKNYTLSVISVDGKKVKEMKNISGSKILLDMSNLPGGIYFIRLTGERNYWKKVVVE